MANGTYGTRRPANITVDKDVDIFYKYRPTRASDSPDSDAFEKIDASSILVPSTGKYTSNNILELPGMYELRLPLDKFGKKGFYTIYIKPKEIFTKIVDVSTLAAYPDIRGVVLEINGNNSEIYNDNELTGYRIELLDENLKKTGEYRIITSNNKCEPVTQIFNDSSQKGIRYIFNGNSTLTFCTVTPSIGMSFKSSSLPNLGTAGQNIVLVNTKFNPIMLEVEMTEHDIDTVSTMLEGKQIRNLERGMITTFNEDGGIYHQASYGTIENPTTGIHHEFKVTNNDNIVYSEEDRLKEIEENI